MTRVPVEDTTKPTEPSQPPKPRFRIPSVGQAGAIVGLIAGILGLVFIAFPAWRPQPPPDTGTVQVSDVRVRQPVSFGRYLKRLKLPPGNLSEQQLSRRGVLIEFQAQIEGFKGKQLPLRWELNDAATNDPVDEDQAVTIKPSTNNEGRTWFVWAPAPESTGKYYVTVTIYQPPKGEVDVPLEAFDSPEFTGLAAP
ncbi:MAG: hypothetical protein H0W14_11940 [Actinobacteria bacterium]|nr:hypothetical protein [Actinomycetota bacterium]